MENCTRTTRYGEYFERCWPDVQPAGEGPEIERGSVLGRLWAALVCSSYSGGAEYDWQTGKYQCNGRVVSQMWRR